MGLKKAHKRFIAKPSKRNSVAFQHALDLWRVDRISRNIIVKHHPDFETARTLIELKKEISKSGKVAKGNMLIIVKDEKVKFFINGKVKPISKIEKALFKTETRRKAKSIDYQLWVISKYLN